MYDLSARPWLNSIEDEETRQAREIASGCHMVRLPPMIEAPVKLPIAATFSLDVSGLALTALACDPSIVVSGGGDVIVNVKAYGDFDSKLNVLGVLDGRKLYSRTAIVGGDILEGVRLFAMNGALHGVASTDASQQVVFRLDGNRVAANDRILSPRRERNWMPAVVCEEGREDHLRLIYSTQPLVVLDYGSRVVGGVMATRVADIPQTLGHIRGGSQLIPYNDGWLAVVRQVHRFEGSAGVRHVHRFAWFDRGLTRVNLGRVFYFMEDGPGEFCAGLAEHDGKFLLGVGLNGKHAVIAEVTRDVIEEYLSSAVEVVP